jgi:hypothetical protein
VLCIVSVYTVTRVYFPNSLLYYAFYFFPGNIFGLCFQEESTCQETGQLLNRYSNSTHTRIHVHACMYTHTCIHAHAHMHAHTHTHTCTLYLYIRTRLHTMYACILIFSYSQVFIFGSFFPPCNHLLALVPRRTTSLWLVTLVRGLEGTPASTPA